MTKELLEEVLNTNINEYYVNENIVYYINFQKQLPQDYIHIAELAFMCKDYTLKQGYILDSQSRGYCRGKGICFIYRDDWTSEFPEHCLESFSGDSEIEAIFRATEWVLLNKGNKND